MGRRPLSGRISPVGRRRRNGNGSRRWHQSLKGEGLRPGVPLTIEEARRLVGRYVDYYNRVRLHRALGDIAPLDKLEGRTGQIFAERDRKLAEARRHRQLRRQQAWLNGKAAGVSLAAGLNGSGRVKRKPALRGRNRAAG